MRGHGQYCPIARGAEVLGDRWTLLIAREMLHGVCRFNELERCLPGISRSVLSQRLRHLQKVGLVVRDTDADNVAGYHLTAAGRDLRPVMQALGDWAATWAFGDPDPAELDPDLVVRWISRHLDRANLPSRRVIVGFEVSGRPTRCYWLVIDADDVSICRQHPGLPVDATIRCDVETLYRVYLGGWSLAQAGRAGRLEVIGEPATVRQLPSWFAWSTFAPAVRTAELRRTAAAAASPA